MHARTRMLAMVVAAVSLAGCSELVPERPRSLISDQQAGERDIYNTDEAYVKAVLDRMEHEVRDLAEKMGGLDKVTVDVLNPMFHDIVFLSGSRQILTVMPPGDGAISMISDADSVVMAMTNDGMTCWGIRIDKDAVSRAGVFAPGCAASELEEAEWHEEWGEAPPPVSSPEGFEFGTRPGSGGGS